MASSSTEPGAVHHLSRESPESNSASVELKQRFDELVAINRMVDVVTRAQDIEQIYAAALE